MNRPSSHFREGVSWELPSSAVGTVQLQRRAGFCAEHSVWAVSWKRWAHQGPGRTGVGHLYLECPEGHRQDGRGMVGWEKSQLSCNVGG